MTARDYAMRDGHSKIAELLEKVNADSHSKEDVVLGVRYSVARLPCLDGCDVVDLLTRCNNMCAHANIVWLVVTRVIFMARSSLTCSLLLLAHLPLHSPRTHSLTNDSAKCSRRQRSVRWMWFQYLNVCVSGPVGT